MGKAKIRWGIISTAKIGVMKVIPAIQVAEHCEVVAISSRDIHKAKNIAQKLKIPKYYGSYEDLIDDNDIDAIYIPLPNNMHIEWTKKSLKAGKHVLCEKPIGLYSWEAKYLKFISLNFPDLKIMEAFMYHFHPQWIKVKSLIAEGKIGDIKTIQSFFSYNNQDPQNIRNKIDTGGGALMDIGCYCISFPRFLLEMEPVRILGLMDHDPEMKIDRLTSGIMDFSGGVTSTFTCSTQLNPYQRVNILGNKGQIEIEIPVNAPPDSESRIWLTADSEKTEILIDPADQYSLQAEAFAKAILNNTEVPFTLEDSIANMTVIDAVFESAESDQWVMI